MRFSTGFTFIFFAELPKGISQPFVVIPKLQVSDVPKIKKEPKPPTPTAELNNSNNTLVSGRSGRTIKPKYDPDFKYLPAGAKKQKRESLDDSGRSTQSTLKPLPKLKPIIKSENGIKSEPAVSAPKVTPLKKRKLKPLHNVCPSYLKKRKMQKLSAPKAQIQRPKPLVQMMPNTPTTLKTESVVHEPLYTLQYQHPIVHPPASPETILPDDIPVEPIPQYQYATSTPVVTSTNYSHYSLNTSVVTSDSYSHYSQNVVKEEAIEICDNGFSGPYLQAPSRSGESVLDFSMF